MWNSVLHRLLSTSNERRTMSASLPVSMESTAHLLRRKMLGAEGAHREERKKTVVFPAR